MHRICGLSRHMHRDERTCRKPLAPAPGACFLPDTLRAPSPSFFACIQGHHLNAVLTCIAPARWEPDGCNAFFGFHVPTLDSHAFSKLGPDRLWWRWQRQHWHGPIDAPTDRAARHSRYRSAQYSAFRARAARHRAASGSPARNGLARNTAPRRGPTCQ